MTPTLETAAEEFGPWNPGIQSPVPRSLRHLATIFRPDNVYTSYGAAEEIAGLTGLAMREVVAFRPGRLALHAVLVRLTAGFSIPDGQKIEDLGINFREIARAILAAYVEPEMAAITSAYDALRRQLADQVRAETQDLLSARPSVHPAPRDSGFKMRDLFAHSRKLPGGPPGSQPAGPQPGAPPDLVARVAARIHASSNERELTVLRALGKVLAALLARHGSVWGGPDLVASVATDIGCNDLGSKIIGALIEPLLVRAAGEQGYRLLPRQERPVVMNTKGPSASGKSTLRPLQRALAGELGFAWSDFALISPDIWRKQLLDYGTLGPDYKYAGAFTGDEVRIIDEKLDQYMAGKASRGEMPHMLIDRFRFDSFAPDSHEAGSNLLTRFGQIVYLFFVITPPASLVERAWQRGLEVGRYKTVDDLLAHSVEAYSGMPELIFTWIQRRDKRVHFELLDNSVRLGEPPLTVAFGWNDTLNVLDVKGMLAIDRFRHVNVDAGAPESLYPEKQGLDAENNTDFLRRSVEQFREINFADQASGRIYLRLVWGRVAGVDREGLRQAASDPDARAGLLAAAPAVFSAADAAPLEPSFLGTADKLHTVGAWGSEETARGG